MKFKEGDIVELRPSGPYPGKRKGKVIEVLKGGVLCRCEYIDHKETVGTIEVPLKIIKQNP